LRHLWVRMMRVTVNGLEAARSACRAACRTIELVTPPDSGSLAGVGYWQEVRRLLRSEFPDLPVVLFVDCGVNAAIAHDALRLGLDVVVDVTPAMFAKLVAIAKGQGLKCVIRNS
jgi:hypothetical protein